MEGLKFDTIKEQLLQERQNLQQRLQEEEERQAAERLRNPDRADLADAYNRGQRISALMARTERQLEEIDAALTKVDEGTYGICDVCENEINPERLRAIPWATLCVKCQEKLER